MHVGFRLYSRPQARREAHIAALSAAGWRFDDIRSALRASTTLQRCAELSSSVEMTEREDAANDRRSDAAMARLSAVASRYGGKAEYSGDPRGCPVLVGCPGLPRTSLGYDGYAID